MKTLTISDETYESIKDQLDNGQEARVKEQSPNKGVTIYNTVGGVLFESNKETIREAVEDQSPLLQKADLRGADLWGADLGRANLRGADLRGANLRGADLSNAKFYGRGGTFKLKQSQVKDFLAALGFIIEEEK